MRLNTYFFEALKTRLENILRSLSGNRRSYIVWGSTTSTDVANKVTLVPKAEIMPGVPASLAELLVFYKACVSHEGAHIKYTRKKDWEEACSRGTAFQHLTNIIEDGRVEAAISRDLPGVGRWLRFANNYFFQHQTNYGKGVAAFLMGLAAYSAVGRIPDVDPETERLIKLAAPWVDIGKASADTLGVLTCVEEILKIPDIEELFNWESPPPPKGERATGRPRKSRPDSKAEDRAEKARKVLKEREEKDSEQDSVDESEEGSPEESKKDSQGNSRGESGGDSNSSDDNKDVSDSGDEDDSEDNEEPGENQNSEDGSREPENDSDYEETSDDDNEERSDEDSDEEESGSPEDEGDKEVKASEDYEGFEEDSGDDFEDLDENHEEISDFEEDFYDDSDEGLEDGEDSDDDDDDLGPGESEGKLEFHQPPVSPDENGDWEAQAGSSTDSEATEVSTLEDDYFSPPEEEDFEGLLESSEKEALSITKDAESLENEEKEINPAEGVNQAVHCDIRLEIHEVKKQPSAYQRMKEENRPLYKQLVQEIRVALESRKAYDLRGQSRGRLHSGSLWKLAVPDPRVFAKRQIPGDVPEVAVYILIDLSGSMSRPAGNGRDRGEYARDAACVLSEACRDLKIPHAVTGFNEDHSPVVRHYPAVTFEDSDSSKIAGLRSGGNNRDGYSIRVATNEILQRSEPRKILFVLSDGLPAGDCYYGLSATADVRGAVLEARKKGVRIISLRFGEDRNEAEFKFMYDTPVFVHDTTLLPRVLGSVFKRVLLE